MKLEELKQMKGLLVFEKNDGTKSYTRFQTDEDIRKMDLDVAVTLFGSYFKYGLENHEDVLKPKDSNKKTLQDEFPNEEMGLFGLVEANDFAVKLVNEIIENRNKGE